MAFYQRRLPHLDNPGRPIFVTFRLHGTLPASHQFLYSESGKDFAATDRILDEAKQGASHLKREPVAAIMETAIRQNPNYELHAWVIMPNHVHLLVTSSIPLRIWLRDLKGTTARACNKHLGLTGPFWQRESYDHEVRNEHQFNSIHRYIENNPVKAGLARSPEAYQYSSAHALSVP